MGRKLGKVLTPVMQRMMEALGVAELNLLAEKLGAPEGTVRNWHKRERVPFEWITKASVLTNKPVEWFTESQTRGGTSFFSSHGLTSSDSGRTDRIGLLVRGSVAPTGRSDRSDVNSYESGARDRSNVNSYGPGGMEAGDVSLEAREKHVDLHAGQPRHHQKRDALSFKDTVSLHSTVGGAFEPIVLVARDESRGLAVEYLVIPWHQREEVGERGNRFGDIAFSTEFMERRFGGRLGFEMLYHRGDSMAPTLIDGEEVVINTNVTRVEENAIYAINVNGRVMLRRVQINVDGSLFVMSDNPAYKPAEIAAANAANLSVIGRMVWPRVR